MPIERTVNPIDGSWEEKATDKKSAQELFEKHAPALQKRGAEDFHKKWLEQNKVGFERVRDPAGNEAYVRADKADQMIQAGDYKPMNLPRTVVPFLPWQADRRYGERYDDYIKRRESETQKAEG